MRQRVTKARSLAAIIVALAAVFWVAASAPAALAAPPAHYDLTQLQALLDANGGTATGYFLTVVGGSQEADQTPIQIPATITDIVPNATQDGSLIMFAAPSQVDGIAAGMSGSPLYVNVSGQPDQLVGAVSYGDMFTTGGLGLATPIQYMIALQSSYLTAAHPAAARSITLAKPIAVRPGVVDRIVVAPSTAKARATKAAPRTAVFAPLTAVQIGGLDPRTKAYKALKAKFEQRGVDVVAAPVGGVSSSSDPDWSTTLDGGTSLGTLFSRGGLTVGALGTVTYRDGTNLLAYGHPLAWLGETEAYLTNAWVSGIWSSTYEPYKIMSPTHLAGTLTQDRNSGVAGVLGTYPTDTVITASSTFAGKTVTSTSTVPRSLASQNYFSILPVEAAWVAVGNDFDSLSLPGSATTTSTVVVNDGTHDYTVSLDNTWDDPDDVSQWVADDLAMMLDTLTYNGDGVAPATIKSVDLNVTMSSHRDSAYVVAVDSHGGLHTGLNTLGVTLLVYGQRTPVTIPVTLTIPVGTPTTGYLRITGGGSGGFGLPGGSPSSSPTRAKGLRSSLRASVDDRPTVADLVDELRSTPKNTDLLVAFQPISADGPGNLIGPEVTPTSWVLGYDSTMTLHTSDITLRALPSSTSYGGSVALVGVLDSPQADTTVEIWARPASGGTYTKIATVPAPLADDGTATFVYDASNLKKSTRFMVIWGGDDASLGCSAKALVQVASKVTLSAAPWTARAGAPVKLTAAVWPTVVGQTVSYQRYVTATGRWVTLGHASVASSGKATLTWRPGRGAYRVRAIVGPSADNLAGASAAHVVTIK